MRRNYVGFSTQLFTPIENYQNRKPHKCGQPTYAGVWCFSRLIDGRSETRFTTTAYQKTFIFTRPWGINRWGLCKIRNHPARSPSGEPAFCWYLGPSLKHYHCHKVWIPQTSSTRIANQVTWISRNLPMPTATAQDLIIASAKDLTATLQLPTRNSILPPPNTITRKALLQLSNIFSNQVNPNDHIIVLDDVIWPHHQISQATLITSYLGT